LIPAAWTVDQHLTGSWLRIGALLDQQHLRSSVL